MMETMYHTLLYAMPVLAVIVFIALFFVKAGYGIFQSRQWGISLPNKVGWVLMECPAFLMMLFFWLQSPARSSSVLLSFFLLFELHYFQRSFIFPMLMKGKSRMPIAITAMGVLFNVINTFLIGYDLFYLHASTYTEAWFTTPSFIGGCLLFFGGMGINLHADHIIRNLRPAGDTRHYLPQKGIYHYVTSGNYFGELVEWTGFYPICRRLDFRTLDLRQPGSTGIRHPEPVPRRIRKRGRRQPEMPDSLHFLTPRLS